MAKLVKKEGNVEICPTCKKEMFCRSKDDGQGGVKLQWQTESGESHYLKPSTNDKGEQVFQCRGFTTSPAVTTTIPKKNHKVIWEVIDEKTPDMVELQEGFTVMRSLAYELVKNTHPDMDDQDGVFGTIVNATIGHMIHLAQVKATKGKSK